MPKLLQLFDARLANLSKATSEDSGGKQKNFFSFRKAITLQDMAKLKVDIRNAQDAPFHLQESERLLKDIFVDNENGINDQLLEAARERNQRIKKKAEALHKEKLEDIARQASHSATYSTSDIFLAVGVFTVSYYAC